MRTEHHLRTALAAREDLVPDPDPVLAGARTAATRHRRRRATATAVAAAGVMVAGVLTVPAVLAGSATPEPEPQQSGAVPPVELPAAEPYDPAQPRPAFTFTIPSGSLGGFELRPVTVAPDYQIAEILRDGDEVATLVVYDPGARTIAGTEGEVNLRWEYAPDGYAEITSPVDAPLDEETAQDLADSLELVAPYPVRVPYRLDYLPAGATPFNVGQYTAESGAFRSVMQVETDSLTLDISISDQPTDIDNPDWDWRATSIAGRPAECVELIDGNRCRVELDEFTVNLGTDDRAEIERIVAGLQPATWEDPATWYELDAALPGA